VRGDLLISLLASQSHVCPLVDGNSYLAFLVNVFLELGRGSAAAGAFLSL